MNSVRPQTVPVTDTDNALSPVASDQAADTTLSEAWLTLRKRKYYILIAALLGIAYGFYQGATQPRLFESYGNIEIRAGSSNEYRISSTSALNSQGSSRIPTEVAILKSDTLLLTVAADLDLANNAAFMGIVNPKVALPHQNIEEPIVREHVLQIMQGDINVNAVPKTDLIRISASTFNAQLSADIVNKLIHDYITRSLESSAEAQKRVSSFLSDQLGDLKNKVETSQEHLLDLQKRLGMVGIDNSHNEITATLDDLTKAAGQAQIDRIMAEVRYRALASMKPSEIDESVNAIHSVVPQSQLPALRGQYEGDQATLAKLSATLGPNNPQVKSVRAELDQLAKAIQTEQDRVVAQARENYRAARAAEDQTRGALETEKTVAYKLRDDLVQYTLQQREFESNRTLYEGLLERLRTAGVQAGLESTEIDIIDNAVAAISPTMRPRSTIIIIDTLIALIIGIIIAFVLDSLDTGLSSVAEIEAVSGLPSLALIPRTRRQAVDPNATTVAKNLGVISTPKSQFSESFRALRTSLLLSTAGHEPKIILLTSATPSEGKTTVSTNLAAVLAQRDVRVLLIDADLRRPTVHHRFGLNGKIGLTSVLTGNVTVEQAVQHVPELPNLDILVSGPVPPFPTEMLSSNTMHALIEHCKGIYTHIVIDSPPLLSVTDSVVLARDADAVVMIVRYGKSGKHAVRRARDLLLRSGAPVTGIALNAVDLNSPEYYSYYGYYGYSGYASAGVDSTGWESKSTRKRNARSGDKEDQE
ncbi:MAG: polysaccharide biosynthesis tyrosine autokinase [Acidobacteriota bacterium]